VRRSIEEYDAESGISDQKRILLLSGTNQPQNGTVVSNLEEYFNITSYGNDSRGYKIFIKIADKLHFDKMNSGGKIGNDLLGRDTV
jgi:hypothetical protein